jgi:hypothetical protein
MVDFGSILFGAVTASIVPVLTLVLNNSRWKKERRIEHLRNKHDKLEKVYLSINEALPLAVADNSYPSRITSLIITYGSEKVKKEFTSFMVDKNKTDEKRRSFILSMSAAANEHLREIERKIEDILT